MGGVTALEHKTCDVDLDVDRCFSYHLSGPARCMVRSAAETRRVVMFFAQHLMRGVIAPLAFASLLTLAALEARAVPLYTIQDLGTLPGKANSIATSINNQDQVVGLSYNGADGQVYDNGTRYRFSLTGAGAQSFLYDKGKTTRIAPVGGPALAINDHGQVVGGPYASINNAGQYVGGPSAGVDGGSYNGLAGLYDNGVKRDISIAPYAINDSGVVVGLVMGGPFGGETHPAMFQDGRGTDLLGATLPSPDPWQADATTLRHGIAVGINNRNDILATVGSLGVPTTTVIYNPTTGEWKNLSKTPGYEGGQGVALNNQGQVVGADFLYGGSTIRKLTDLIPPSSGWSGLHPMDINDSGWIVGQGTIDGQLHAFLMMPEPAPVPEPSTVLVWALAAVAGFRFRPKRRLTGPRPR
jgi:hypothetical protein